MLKKYIVRAISLAWLIIPIIGIVSGCGKPTRFIVTNEYSRAADVNFNNGNKVRKSRLQPQDSTVFDHKSTELYIGVDIDGKHEASMKFGNVNEGRIDKYGNKLPEKIGSQTARNMFVTGTENYDGIEISYVTISNKELPVVTSDEVTYLKLSSNETNVEIYFDGERIGTIEDGLFNKKVPSGEHQLMARKEFFMPITINVELVPNDVFPYNFELRNVKGWIEEKPDESRSEQARGDLTIVTERNDLKVFIEGYERTPPLDIEKMPAGIYTIVVKGPEVNKELQVVVKESEKTFIDLDEILK